MAMLRSLLLLFIVFSIGNTQVNSFGKCPYGWLNFGVRCYKIVSQPANWIIAERSCQSLGGNLASVHSTIEQEFLLNLCPSSTYCWIGAHDGSHEGQWLWTDGTPFDFAHFTPGQPDNYQGNENCLQLNWPTNRWNDARCTISLAYICAKYL
ncbi:ladderlectin-like [Labeo rohita]|uniref:ladderlectin-like n=1 Tax=Labeo rohita TaxID=84645 RepID=UPI0021E24CC3|nr:ladderlectin-like [Labeo rohita]